MRPAEEPASTDVDVPIGDDVDVVMERWADVRPDISPASIGVFGRINRVYRVQGQLVADLYRDYGLSPAAFEVMSNLRRAPGQRAKAGELASDSLLTTGGVTFRLDRLEAEGWVRRVRSVGDRRVVYAELTELGREKIDEVYRAHIALEQSLLSSIPEAERELLAAGLRELNQAVTLAAAEHAAPGSEHAEAKLTS